MSSVLAFLGCDGGWTSSQLDDPSPPTSTPSPAPPPTADGGGQRDPDLESTVAVTPRSRGGGPVVVARVAGRDRVLVGDRDHRAVVVADPVNLEVRSRVDLAGRPEQLVVAGGRVFTVLRDQNRLVALATDGRRWAQVAAVDTAVEPVALAAAPDGSAVYVTAAWGRRLTAYDPATLGERWSVPLARSPRGIAASPDGRRLYVAHMVGGVTSEVRLGPEPEVITRSYAGVDSSSPSFRRRHGFPGGGICGTGMMRLMRSSNVPREGSQGFAVVASDDEAWFPAVLVHPRTGGHGGAYGSGGTFPGQEPVLASVAADGGEAVGLRVANDSFSTRQARSGFSGGHRRDGCLLPRHAALDGPSDTILVACVGSGQVIAHRQGRPPLSLSTPRRWAVADGPVGLAVDEASRVAFVWSQFAGTLSRIDLSSLVAAPTSPRVHWPDLERDVKQACLGAGTAADALPRLSAAAAQGRRLFHATGDPRLSADGRSCASCHPDGRDDGLSWPTPHGDRQTPMLAGRLGPETAPYGWEGDAGTVAEHLRETFRRLGGGGLDGVELDALLAYLHEMPTPSRRPAREAALVERGRALFHDDANVGCAVCHVEATGSNGGRHDVGGGAEVETPSLRFVAGTAPYFHDGRFSTLGELLEESAGTMGWAHRMTAPDRRALEAYLHTL